MENSNNLPHTAYVSIEDALLCANCDTIYSLTIHKICPRCTSEFYLALAPVLKRVELLEPARELCKVE